MSVPEDDPRFRSGIDHFNRGEFFEAHEVWEDYWIEVNDERKGFLKGMIQAAVALHHAGRLNFAGARTLYRRMRANLDPYRPAFLGLDVDAFLAALEAAIGPVFREPPEPMAEALPKIP